MVRVEHYMPRDEAGNRAVLILIALSWGYSACHEDESLGGCKSENNDRKAQEESTCYPSICNSSEFI